MTVSYTMIRFLCAKCRCVFCRMGIDEPTGLLIYQCVACQTTDLREMRMVARLETNLPINIEDATIQ